MAAHGGSRDLAADVARLTERMPPAVVDHLRRYGRVTSMRSVLRELELEERFVAGLGSLPVPNADVH